MHCIVWTTAFERTEVGGELEFRLSTDNKNIRRIYGIFKLCYLLMFITSLGAGLFHTTLSKSGQVYSILQSLTSPGYQTSLTLDAPLQYLYEMSMVWTTLICLYSIMSVGQEVSATNNLIIVVHGFITSCVYFKLSFDFFFFTRGFSIALIFIVSRKVLQKIPQGFPEHKSCALLLKTSFILLVISYVCLLLPEILILRKFPAHCAAFQMFGTHALSNILDMMGQYFWVVYVTLVAYHWENRSPKLSWTLDCIPHARLPPKQSQN